MTYYVYKLKQNRSVVYIGYTNTISRRLKEHKSEKTFNFHEILYRTTSKKDAQRKEEEVMRNYYNYHGRTPKYNKTRR